MLVDNDSLKYLSGQEFHNSYCYKLPLKITPEKRVDYLKNLVKGKKVIHLGCLDHVPLINQKINKGQWLHKILTDNALKCIGFDINEIGIKEFRSLFEIDNIYYDDITLTRNEMICKEKWDFLLLGEVLEHINNPTDFLKKLRDNYSGIVDKIIITVPNVLASNRFKAAKKGIENINTDHRYWFTPFTIMKVATMAGLKPINLEFKNRIPLAFFQLVLRKFYKVIFKKEPYYPFFYFDTLVLISDLSDNK